MKGVTTWFMALWCLLMPVTSFLIIPSAQGTIPAYLLGFASILLVIFSYRGNQLTMERTGYFKIALLMMGLWVLLLCGSQLGHLLSDRRDFGQMVMNSPDDTRVVLRSVTFTQSLYLAACLSIALFFRFFFCPQWMRYVLWGGWFLAIYGIYEWLYFLIFQQPGDFIANRTYGEGLHPGSWSQITQIGPLSLLRIKSTFGEPSFFSAAVIPYLFLALQNRRKWLTVALLFCVLFSVSTSSFIALPFGLLLYSLFQKKIKFSVVLLILLFAGALAVLYFAYPETFDSMFTAKMNGENESGAMHQQSAIEMRETLVSFTPMNWVFGVGFGYTYSMVFYVILLNTGLIGMAVYLYSFLKPVLLLRADSEGLGLKVGVATLFFLFYLNVSELFLPTTWMFLGLAYWQLDRQQRESREAHTNRRADHPLAAGITLGRPSGY
jgi:hypothetical protein